MPVKKNIITFNHFSKDLNFETRTLLYNMYVDNFVKCQCYKLMLKRAKTKCMIFDIASYLTTITGAGASFASVFSLVLVPIGVAIGIYKKHQNFEKKKETLSLAYTSYKKVLNEIRSFFRGQSFNEKEFVRDCLINDNTISDLCPPITTVVREKILERYEVKYIIDRRDATIFFGQGENDERIRENYKIRESIRRQSQKSNPPLETDI